MPPDGSRPDDPVVIAGSDVEYPDGDARAIDPDRIVDPNDRLDEERLLAFRESVAHVADEIADARVTVDDVPQSPPDTYRFPTQAVDVADDRVGILLCDIGWPVVSMQVGDFDIDIGYNTDRATDGTETLVRTITAAVAGRPVFSDAIGAPASRLVAPDADVGLDVLMHADASLGLPVIVEYAARHSPVAIDLDGDLAYEIH